MLHAGGDKIDACGLNAGVAQHVCQLGDILINAVERPGKQVPQIVGEYFRFLHSRLFAQRLEFRPDLAAGQSFSVSGEKNLAGDDFLFLSVFLQFPAQLSGQEDRADFPFQGNVRPSGPRRLNCDILYLADADARGADHLHQQGQAVPAQADRRVEQLFVLFLRQVFVRATEQPALDFQILDPEIVPAKEGKEFVQGGQLGVDSFRLKARLFQMFLPRRRQFLRICS